MLFILFGALDIIREAKSTVSVLVIAWVELSCQTFIVKQMR